ncbi:MAG: hypothetical protein WA610_05765, partial [Thermodesulfovibrionales bacterium]
MSGCNHQKQIIPRASFVHNNSTGELYRSDIIPLYTELYRQSGSLIPLPLSEERAAGKYERKRRSGIKKDVMCEMMLKIETATEQDLDQILQLQKKAFYGQ